MATNKVLEIVIKAKDEATATLKGLSGTLKANEKDLKAVAVASGVAFAGIVAFASNAVSKANEAQKVQAQLGAVLKSTGGIAGVTADEAIKLSRALQSVTTYGDEAILSAENMLLTFTNIGKDIFPDATKTVLDMSTALGQDLKSSSIQLGKALNDPIAGVTALRRVGVNFTEQQQEMIRVMVESGRTMDAQKFILQELATEFGGSATAEAQTFGGQIKQINELVGDLNESIGVALVPILSKLASALKPVITNIIQWIEKHPELTSAIIIATTLVAGLTFALTTLSVAFIAVQVAMGPIGWIILGIGTLITVMLIPTITLLIKHWDLLKEGAIQAFLNIGETTNSVINIVIAYFTNLKNKLKLIWNDIKGVFKDAIAGITDMFQGLMDFVNKLATTIENALSKALELVGLSGGSKKKKATGGGVQVGESYLVGENGPELFSPATTGSIIPNAKLAGNNGMNVTININGGTYLSDETIEDIGDRIIQGFKRVAKI